MLKRYFTLLCAAALASGAAQAQKISVAKGLKLEMITNVKMVMTMEMMGQSMDNNIETSNTTQVELKDIMPDSYLFSNTVTKMLLHSNGMGQEINFDSDKKEDRDGQIGESLKGMLNVPQEILVSKQGKVLERKGDTSAAANRGMTEMMNITGSMMKGQPYQLLLPLPAHPLKAGETWVDSSGSTTTMKSITTYTVKSISKEEVALDFVSQVSRKGTMEQQGMQIEMELNGTIKGNASYEAASGVLKKTDSTTDMKGSMSVMGQSIPFSATVTGGIVAAKKP